MLRATATKALRPASMRLAQAQIAARRFASSDSHGEHKSEEHHVFEEEGFSSPLWKYSIGAIGAFYLISKYDAYVEESGRVHPVTKFFASIMTDKEENKRIFSEYQKEVAKRAEFNILQWEEKKDTVSSLDTAVYYKRTAKWGTAVGTEVDMSGAKHRTPIKE
ncbi:hypothetical protein GQ54DRAFT_329550 [Martensiomyces pterosporus]|nr:hypothetical protein GQ54DRAFT_329550 [Martensiomyces pterosporus]